MKKFYIYILIFFGALNITFSQVNIHEKYQFRHIVKLFEGDSVDVVIKSAKGEENIKKPIFLFIQGSLPKPIFLFENDDIYEVFPFNPSILTDRYHLVIIGKPYIPLSANVKNLGQNYSYIEDSTGKFPKKYSDRNLPDYYVNRNISVLKYLLKQDWVDDKQLVIAGHSEGSNIAARIAEKYSKVTHIIYASGNPYGRIATIISQSRSRENYNDSNHYAENDFKYWEETIKNKNDMDDSYGDTFKATYDFSEPPIIYLEKLKIPVLVVYGNKDWSATHNDLMRIEFLRQNKKNFTFFPIIGAEHNFFPKDSNGKINYEEFNWDNVANYWKNWLSN
jgi:dienelactone hydrolase